MIQSNALYEMDEARSPELCQGEQDSLRAEQRQQNWLRLEQDEQEYLHTG